MEIWLARVPLIFFEMVEWHFPDRVLRQFGLRQDIPRDCETSESLHGVTRSGKRAGHDWAYEHRVPIGEWDRRRELLVDVTEAADPYQPSQPYRWWFWRITRRIINPPDTSGAHRHQPSGDIVDTHSDDMAFIFQQAVIALQHALPDPAREAVERIQARAQRSIQLDPVRQWRATQYQDPVEAGDGAAGGDAEVQDDADDADMFDYSFLGLGQPHYPGEASTSHEPADVAGPSTSYQQVDLGSPFAGPSATDQGFYTPLPPSTIAGSSMSSMFADAPPPPETLQHVFEEAPGSHMWFGDFSGGHLHQHPIMDFTHTAMQQTQDGAGQITQADSPDEPPLQRRRTQRTIRRPPCGTEQRTRHPPH